MSQSGISEAEEVVPKLLEDAMQKRCLDKAAKRLFLTRCATSLEVQLRGDSLLQNGSKKGGGELVLRYWVGF